MQRNLDQNLEFDLEEEPEEVQWLFERAGDQIGTHRCILWHSICAKYIIPLEGSLLLPALQFAKLQLYLAGSMSAVAGKWLSNDRIAEHCNFWQQFIANYLKTQGKYRVLRYCEMLERCRILAKQNRNYLVKEDFIAREPTSASCPFFGATNPSYNGQLYLNPRTFEYTVVGDDAYFLIPADPYVIRPQNFAILNEQPGLSEPYIPIEGEHFFKVLYTTKSGDEEEAFVYVQGNEHKANIIHQLVMNATNIGGNTLCLCQCITNDVELGEKYWDIYQGGVACFQLGRKDKSTVMYETRLPEGFVAYAPGSSWGEGKGPVKEEEELSDGTPIDWSNLSQVWSDEE